MFLDPVCGMEITNNEKAEKFEYNNKTYYFCSSQCLNQFLSVLIKLSSEKKESENDQYSTVIE